VIVNQNTFFIIKKKIATPLDFREIKLFKRENALNILKENLKTISSFISLFTSFTD
jgi:hypothetical protein